MVLVPFDLFVCEIQLQLKWFTDMKKLEHKYYKTARHYQSAGFSEYLEKCNFPEGPSRDQPPRLLRRPMLKREFTKQVLDFGPGPAMGSLGQLGGSRQSLFSPRMNGMAPIVEYQGGGGGQQQGPTGPALGPPPLPDNGPISL